MNVGCQSWLSQDNKVLQADVTIEILKLSIHEIGPKKSVISLKENINMQPYFLV